ncbi:MAG: Uma2 family endonuclease [Microcystaceae cyanobacterium]
MHCLRQGTQMGWLIDPAEQMLLIYCPPQEPVVLDQPAEMIPVPQFASALQLTVKGLFTWLWD